MAYQYDRLSRLSSVIVAAQSPTLYNYDAVGNLSGYSYPNGVATTFQYDNLNRLTSLASNANGTAVASYAYTLGTAGNRTGVTELSGRTVSYGYDSLYRLTSENIAGSLSGVNGSLTYQYDSVGNRKSIASTLPAINTWDYSYDANDRIAGFAAPAYDNNGNTISSADIADGYDFENRLVLHGGMTFVYDGDGNRVAKTVAGVTTSFLVDTVNPTGYAQVLDELQSGFVKRSYAYGLELISETQVTSAAPPASPWATSYYGYDGHGSVRYLTDATGSVTDTYDYDAFGSLIASTGSTPNLYLFAGEQYDPDLGLYYNRARYLDTHLGRFWGMDTDEGDEEDPLSLHKYLYASANPVNEVDPSGKTPLTSFIAQLAAHGVQIAAQVYGTMVHASIEADLEQQFPGMVYPEFVVAGGEIDAIILAGGAAHVFEIKPVGGTVNPTKQIKRYIAALGATFLGFPVIPGSLSINGDVRGPLLVERVKYNSAGAGIIYYEPYLPNNNFTISPVPIGAVLTAALMTFVGLSVTMGALGPTAAVI